MLTMLACAGWKWQGQVGRLIDHKVEEVAVISDVECMNRCVLHDVCDSFYQYRRSHHHRHH